MPAHTIIFAGLTLKAFSPDEEKTLEEDLEATIWNAKAIAASPAGLADVAGKAASDAEIARLEEELRKLRKK